ncbi:MAG: hypothetical protein EA400_06960 [Chromatiaceae bacterium]|nr:MAG: hypothetical protein EA400_06960 [Chromatiaceae bacterium]
MPEGDTVHKLMVFLDTALRGRDVAGVRLHPALGPSRGTGRISAVVCQGKHLTFRFADGSELRSHLGLYGAWHRYRPGASWHKPARQASILIDAGDWLYVCFNARAAQWLCSGGPRAVDQQQRLGADLIAERIDPVGLLGRVAALPASSLLVDVLLDQHIAAGIGNVYKSEVLFLGGCHPWQTLGETPPATLLGLYRRAADLLQANLGGGRRQTRDPRDGCGRLWVYGRRGLPCLRCGQPIRRGLLGVRPRSTYWCPDCQGGDSQRPPATGRPA